MMIRRISFLLMIVILSVALVPTVSAAPEAVTPVSYSSGFQVRNLTSTPASITLKFMNQDGTTALELSDTVQGNATNSYFPLNDANLPGTGELTSGFKGSLVIYGDQPLAAMSNLVGNGSNGQPISYASYSGFSMGSSSVNIPLLMKNNYGYSTEFSVQNTGGADANIKVTYSDGTTNTFNGLKPGSSHTFQQASESHSASVFSAIVESLNDQDLAAVVVEVGPTTLFGYGGFGAGSTSLNLPLINENNSGYFTGVQVQNLGDQSTDVTISYTPGVGWPGQACTEKRTVPAGKSVTFAQFVFTNNSGDTVPVVSNCVKGATFIGSGVVTANSTSQPLVAVVNQLNTGDNKGAAYMGFDPNSGNQKVVFPLIMDRNFGYFTSWSIVNVGSSTIAKASLTCTVTGKDKNGAAVSKTFNPTADLAQNGSWTLNHINQIANGFVGGATCVGPSGAKLIGTANELQLGVSIDSFLVYEGVSTTP